MKFKYFLCILVALCTIFVIACKSPSNDTDSGKDTSSESVIDTSTDTNADTSTDTNADTSTDTSADTSTDTNVDTSTDTNVDTSTDTSTDISTDTSFDTTTDTTTDVESDTKPDPKPEPIEPIDETITLFANGVSEYTIVYPKNNQVIDTLVKDLVNHIANEYGVTIPYKAVDYLMDEGDKEIVLGNVRRNSRYAAFQIKSTNDFILDVCDNDYMIFASSDAMYAYAFAILKDEILPMAKDNTLSIEPQNEYVYSKSTLKATNFGEYAKQKSGKTQYDYEVLCDFFIGMSFTASDNTQLPYRMYLPSDYDGTKSYPVIVFLHGAGERGTDNVSQMKNMLSVFFNRDDKAIIEQSIIIVPQCPKDNQWVDTPWKDGNYSIDTVKESNELNAVVELLNTVKSKYATDEDRYYAMGISMGGFGTWDLIMRHKDMFAAAVPVCGGADLSEAEALKNMPIYTAHGKWDNEVPFDDSTKDMVEALKKAGSTRVIYKEYSAGHVMWDNVAKEANILEWLFGQKRGINTGENGTPVVPMSN